jgi:hypothetical protein
MSDKIPSKAAQVRALRKMRESRNRQPNPFEDAARGRDPAPKSSDRSRVGDNPRPHGASLQQGAATSSKPSTATHTPHGKGSDAANVAKPQIEPESAPPQSPSETKPKFDRNEAHRNYMRDYMRRRRQAEKREGSK